MPDPDHINFLEKFWAHIVTGIAGLGIVFRKRIGDIIRYLMTALLKDHSAALAAHEERDIERFGQVKETINQNRAEILDALRDNFQILREDLNESNKRTDKRLEFLEKVFLDERLRSKNG